MIIAQRLQIPIYGVNLPQHFILTYLDDTEIAEQLPVAKRDPLFYINAFNKGMVFGRKEIDQFLQLIKMEADDRYYHACSVHEIVIRIFNNLITAYQDQKKEEKVAEMQALRDMVSVYLAGQSGEQA
jgi:regulator of sirC expression with transglutaminase-like and TPR domain